jgi:hypothetical protein
MARNQKQQKETSEKPEVDDPEQGSPPPVQETTDTTPTTPTNTNEAAQQDEAPTTNPSPESNEATGLMAPDDFLPAIKEAADALVHTERERFKAVLLAGIALSQI